MGWPFAVMQDIRNLERSRLLQAGCNEYGYEFQTRDTWHNATQWPPQLSHRSATPGTHACGGIDDHDGELMIDRTESSDLGFF